MSAILTSEQLANAPAHDVVESHKMLQELVDTLRGQLGTERNMQRTLRDELSVHAETNHRLRSDLGAEQSAHDRLKGRHETLMGRLTLLENEQLQDWEAARRRCWIDTCAHVGGAIDNKDSMIGPNWADKAVSQFEKRFPRPAGGAA